jgi:chaperonin cofactor prefoldin
LPDVREEPMAMDTVLKQLETKIEELLKSYQATKKNEIKLAARVEELEGKIASNSEMSARCKALEEQRDELGKRLEKVLSLIDATLSSND